jgi:hypothetical protein
MGMNPAATHDARQGGGARGLLRWINAWRQSLPDRPAICAAIPGIDCRIGLIIEWKFPDRS